MSFVGILFSLGVVLLFLYSVLRGLLYRLNIKSIPLMITSLVMALQSFTVLLILQNYLHLFIPLLLPLLLFKKHKHKSLRLGGTLAVEGLQRISSKTE